MTRLSVLIEMVSVIDTQLKLIWPSCAHSHREVGQTAPFYGLPMFSQTPARTPAEPPGQTLLALLRCWEVTTLIIRPKSTPEVVLFKDSVLSARFLVR